jgi:hypothetical protein
LEEAIDLSQDRLIFDLTHCNVLIVISLGSATVYTVRSRLRTAEPQIQYHVALCETVDTVVLEQVFPRYHHSAIASYSPSTTL